MISRMGLSLSCQSNGYIKRTGKSISSPSIVMAPESALGSHPCVALSSAQANVILAAQMLENKMLKNKNQCNGVDKSS